MTDDAPATRSSQSVPVLWSIVLGVISSLIASLIVVVIGPFVPTFTVDRRRFFVTLAVALVAYVTGVLSYVAIARSRTAHVRWRVVAGVLALTVVTILPAMLSVAVDGAPLVPWDFLAPDDPPPATIERVTEHHTAYVMERPSAPAPSERGGAAMPSQGASPPADTPPRGRPRTRAVELPIGTSWDIDNWEEAQDYDTRDFRLGTGETITFREVAEAQPDWTLADCEDPELRAWSDENERVDVDAEHLMFCVRTSTGAISLLRVERMPDWDQVVRTWELGITVRQ